MINLSTYTMKTLLITAVVLCTALIGFGQREFSYTEGDTTYMMKRYVFMHLLTGENRSQDSVQAAHIQEQHLAHLNAMAKSGKLVVAGPFEKGGDYRGLLIFDVETVEDALKLESEDPAVKSGRLRMQAFFWWGAQGTRLP